MSNVAQSMIDTRAPMASQVAPLIASKPARRLPLMVDPSGRRWLVNPQGQVVEVPANMAAALAERAARGRPVDARAVPYTLQSSFVAVLAGRTLPMSAWHDLLEGAEELHATIHRVLTSTRRRLRREATRRAA